MSDRTLRLAITPGEPAGIGPDLVVQLAQQASASERVVIADPALLQARAELLGLPLQLYPFDPAQPRTQQAHQLAVLPVSLRTPCQPGRLDPANADYVLETLARATDACLDGTLDAIVTAPVHKGVINDAGIAFSGHTEFLAERCQAQQVVMMLACPGLRVALVTTHLPLRAVADAITPERLERVIRVLHHDLVHHFGLSAPRILVLGLNPHAGEGGHMGREEIEVIEPVLARLRQQGINLSAPLPADTAFNPEQLLGGDAVLAMYHDQGLPVLKHKGFGNAVNITLGLPIIRTSVDHGTALELAGSGRAKLGSLQAALIEAEQMARSRFSHE